MLFDTIDKLCLNYNNTDYSNEIQTILSNIFDTILLAEPIHIMAINMALIDLISKLLLSDNIKGNYLILFEYFHSIYLIF